MTNLLISLIIENMPELENLVINDILSRCYPDLVIPVWTINTLDPDELKQRIKWCEDKRAYLQSYETHGDAYLMSREFITWLDDIEARLKHWLETIPN